MSTPQDPIRVSYDRCHRIARRAGSSFYPTFFLLPRSKRRAMEAVYAFMRHTDDLADNAEPVDVRRQALSQWRTSLTRALAQQSPSLTSASDACGEGFLPALADTVRRYRIPPQHLFDVIDGVEMDLLPRTYETFDELAVYCQRVASAVGVVCIHIWGFRDEAAIAPARSCGIAVQMTNILRDLKEDAQAGRVYLPLEDLRRCDYTVDDLLRGVVDERFRRLVSLEVDRANGLYREGAQLMRFLTRDGQRIFGMMMALYRTLLDEIRRTPERLFVQRIHLRRWQKWRIALRWLLLPPGKVFNKMGDCPDFSGRRP